MSVISPTAVGPLAAIDLGSNSFRLEIGQVQDGRYRRHLYLKETVRLGAGLDVDGMLTEEATERGLKCLATFAQTLKSAAPMQVRAVATQTLREAANRDAFLLRAEAALGHPIEVISGREEARLIYNGVAFLQPTSSSRLVVDIGGRSTEMIIGRGPEPRVAESFRVGCVSLSMRYFGDGRYTRSAFRAAQIAAGAELEEGLQQFAHKNSREVLGSSGTAGAVSEVLRAGGRTDGRITPAGLRWLIERCLESGHIDKLELPGLRPERRAVLAGGVAILYTLMSIVILFRFKDRSTEADREEARLEASGDWPAVDIFICTYNEPQEVVEKSIIPALAVDYPNATVWVCDDTRRGWREEILVQENPDRAKRVGRSIEVANRFSSRDLTRRRNELGIDAIARELLPVVRPGLAGTCSCSTRDGARERLCLENRIRNRSRRRDRDGCGRRCAVQLTKRPAGDDENGGGEK